MGEITSINGLIALKALLRLPKNDGVDDSNIDGTTVDDTIGAAAAVPAQKAVEPNAVVAAVAAVAVAADPAIAGAAGNKKAILCPLVNCYFIFHT
jgi:hypothetical protein